MSRTDPQAMRQNPHLGDLSVHQESGHLVPTKAGVRGRHASANRQTVQERLDASSRDRNPNPPALFELQPQRRIHLAVRNGFEDLHILPTGDPVLLPGRG